MAGCPRSCSRTASARPRTRSPRRRSNWPGPALPCSPGPPAGSALPPGRSRWTRPSTRSRTSSSWSAGWRGSRGCCWTGPGTRGRGSPGLPTAARSPCWPPRMTTGSTRSRRRAPGTTWLPRCSRMPPEEVPRPACSRSNGRACCSARARPGPGQPRAPRVPADPRRPPRARSAPRRARIPCGRHCAAGSCPRSARCTSRWPPWAGPPHRRWRCCCAPPRPAWRAGSAPPRC